ncbi:hypothetical protein [Candidatus Pyrohabitans sp.]
MERERLGLILIALGVAVWPVAAVLNITTRTALALHLSLIIPGVYLRGSRVFGFLRRK